MFSNSVGPPREIQFNGTRPAFHHSISFGAGVHLGFSGATMDGVLEPTLVN